MKLGSCGSNMTTQVRPCDSMNIITETNKIRRMQYNELIVKQYINIIDIYILLLLYLILQQHHLLVDIHRHRRHRQY